MSVDTETQLDTLRELIATVLQGNRFYTPILHEAGIDAGLASLDAFIERCPFTIKAQLAADHAAHPPYGSNLSFPLDRYTRYCQTSGTTGRPMHWLDTNDSWDVLLDCWRRVFEAAGCAPGERTFFAFSFGPFLGFWTAFEAAAKLNYLAIPGGGMTSPARLRCIFENQATTLCCTPTYALHLAQTAAALDIDLHDSPIQRIIVAGEPGGSVPATRQLIASLWGGARVCDHHGLTEVGPVTYEEPDRPRTLRVITDAYLHEVVDPDTLEPGGPGGQGELVLTTLKRTACPLLRYRTGDLVQTDPDDPALLVGGILGRVDDMLTVRGVNIFPAAIDQLIREHAGIAEYRVMVDDLGAMTELRIDIEPGEHHDAQALRRDVMQGIRDALHLRVDVQPVAPDTLPRFEFKAKRWRRASAEEA